jgi:hypothetical protein
MSNTQTPPDETKPDSERLKYYTDTLDFPEEVKSFFYKLYHRIRAQEKLDAEAEEVSASAYWEDVDAIAQEVFDENPGNNEHRDDYDRIYQSVDSSGWIIWYSKSQRVMNLGESAGYTDNEDAWVGMGIDVNSLGHKGKQFSLDDIITQMAHCAMVADVQNKLNELREAHEEPEEPKNDDDSAIKDEFEDTSLGDGQ